MLLAIGLLVSMWAAPCRGTHCHGDQATASPRAISHAGRALSSRGRKANGSACLAPPPHHMGGPEALDHAEGTGELPPLP